MIHNGMRIDEVDLMFVFGCSRAASQTRADLGSRLIRYSTDHFYPAEDWLLQKDTKTLEGVHDKNFFVGELDWTGEVRFAFALYWTSSLI